MTTTQLVYRVAWGDVIVLPFALVYVDLGLGRSGQRWAIWLASVVAFVLGTVIYVVFLHLDWNHNGPRSTYGPYPTVFEAPKQLLGALVLYGLPAVAVGWRAASIPPATDWHVRFRRTATAALLSVIVALPLGLWASIASCLVICP